MKSGGITSESLRGLLNFMFRWDYQYTMEVDTSIKDAWDFFTDPSHWLKWDDRFESCFLTGDFKPGAEIRAKIKDKPIHITFLITEVKPYSECRVLLKSLFFREESLVLFKESLSGKTQMTFENCVLGLLVPFLKSTLNKNAKQVYAKIDKSLCEAFPAS